MNLIEKYQAMIDELVPQLREEQKDSSDGYDNDYTIGQLMAEIDTLKNVISDLKKIDYIKLL